MYEAPVYEATGIFIKVLAVSYTGQPVYETPLYVDELSQFDGLAIDELSFPEIKKLRSFFQ